MSVVDSPGVRPYERAMFPHGALEQLEEHLFCVKGEIKFKALGRRMVIVRDPDGGLFIHNAIMLENFTPLDALGEVRAIFVPNRFHDMDAGRMKERYPEARLTALPAAKKKLEKKFPALEALEAPPWCAAITPLSGLKGDEPVMEVKSARGVTQVYTDALFNLPHGSGLGGALLKVIGTSGGFKMSGIGRLALLADRAAFIGYLEAQAARTDIERVIVSHGDMVVGNDAVRAAFARAAQALA